MTEIVINHSGSIPNVDAMEACIKFAYENYARRNIDGYVPTREVTTDRGFKVEVTEHEHPDKENSRCSVIFNVKEVPK